MDRTILVLVPHFLTVYNLRRELIQALVSRRYRVVVACPEDERAEQLRALGCEVEVVPVDRRGLNPASDLLLTTRYIRLIHRVKPGVVLTFTVKPNTYGGIAARALRTPAIANITGTGSTFMKQDLKALIVRCLYRPSLRKASVVFFQNEEDRTYFQSHGLVQGRTKLLPGSGVNLDQFQSIARPVRPRVRFLFIGRLLTLKGIGDYIHAAQTITQSRSDAEFHVVGPPEEGRWDEVLEEAQRTGVLTYHGFRSDITAALGDVDCLVLPSHGGEGVPNVLLEAAATGLPSIVSDISGTRAVIVEGVTGTTFAPGNKDGLVDAIEAFLDSSRESRSEMGRQARIWMEQNFSRTRVVESYIEEIQHSNTGQ